MGLLFNLDTDTVKGPTTSLYCRIDQITIQKEVNRIIISLSYFNDVEKTSRIDSISYEVLVYEDSDSEGKDIRLPSTLKLDLGEKVVIKEPIYKQELVQEKVPYVSFDSQGDEITKYREIEVEKNIKIGEEENEVLIPSFNAIQKDLFQFCYGKIKEELLKTFPYLEIKEV